jgi:molybdopterin-containing oxidoreductase family membrane subunit
MSLGWSGSLSEWRHYNRSYLYFAAIATPLVVSVHSIVSWDFAMSLLPGWHSTLFAPYFVAGAIHSGLAMALTLMIPMRKLLHLEELITIKHLEMISRVIILTTLILAYSYIIEPLLESYSGNRFNMQFSQWRMTGPHAWIFYMVLILNIAVPLSFVSGRFRRKIRWLFLASILINIGMWFERYMIVTESTSHDFLPHNWGPYVPTWVDLSIFAGLAAFFFFMFMAFAKFLPTISIADFKDYLLKDRLPQPEACVGERIQYPEGVPEIQRKLYVFPSADILIMAVKSFCEKNFKDLETFTPTKVPEVEKTLGIEKSPVKYWTLAGGVAGFVSGYLLTVEPVKIFDLIAGGKPPVSLIPYFLIMFELTVLLATIANLASSLYYTSRERKKVRRFYDKRFSADKIVAEYEQYYEEVVNA